MVVIQLVELQINTFLSLSLSIREVHVSGAKLVGHSTDYCCFGVPVCAYSVRVAY